MLRAVRQIPLSP